MEDIWRPAARAALLSGGYNKYYWADDYWTPTTFDQAFEDFYGRWCNQDGNVTDSSPFAEIRKTISGTYLVGLPASEDPVYLKYCIDENTYPAFPGDAEKKDNFLTNEDLKSNAVIEVYIDDETTASSLKLFGGKADENRIRIDKETGKAQLDIPAETDLTFAAFDQHDIELDKLPAVTWQEADENDACEVTPEGLFTATEAGKYEVQVVSDDLESNPVPIVVEEAPVQ